MFRKSHTRRAFLRHATRASAVAYVTVSWMGVGGMLRPRTARAAAYKSLSADEAKTLLQLARTLYPHDRLGDEYFEAAVEGIDGEMAGSADLAKRVKDGLAGLNKSSEGMFSMIPKEGRVKAVKGIEGTPFFSDMLGKVNFYFYNNKKVWPQFGYEGSSWEKGGYLNRGFNDLSWLP